MLIFNNIYIFQILKTFPNVLKFSKCSKFFQIFQIFKFFNFKISKSILKSAVLPASLMTFFHYGANCSYAILDKFNCFSNKWHQELSDFFFNCFSTTTIHGSRQFLQRLVQKNFPWKLREIKQIWISRFKTHLVLDLWELCPPSTTTYFFSLRRNVLILLKAFPPLLLDFAWP